MHATLRMSRQLFSILGGSDIPLVDGWVVVHSVYVIECTWWQVLVLLRMGKQSAIIFSIIRLFKLQKGIKENRSSRDMLTNIWTTYMYIQCVSMGPFDNGFNALCEGTYTVACTCTQ